MAAANELELGAIFHFNMTNFNYHIHETGILHPPRSSLT